MTPILLALSGAAHAFCGAYLGSADASLVNHDSRVILGRDAGTTTLTLAADVEASTDDFALVLPVPTVLSEDDVAVVDPALVQFVFDWSAPRSVAYSCEDAREKVEYGADVASLGCYGYETSFSSKSDGGLAPAGEADASGVTVEAEFSEAEYDIVVLSATGAEGLQAWLDLHGYTVPDAAAPVLQDYIDAGVYFLAARVDLKAVPAGRTWLSPLQIRYPAESLGLPIRIGTTVAEGTQEVVVVTLTEGGGTGISNYPEAVVKDECMWDAQADGDLVRFYGDRVEAAVAKAGGAAWILEHRWPLGQKCDPCTSPQAFDAADLAALGAPEWGTVLTRLRMRYTPELADQDLVLYESGIGRTAQTRFIAYDEQLEYLLRVCGEGWVEDPGECPDEGRAARGCSVPARPVLAGVVLALVGLLRRRGQA